MFFKVIFIKQKLEEGNFMYNVLVCDDDKEIVEAIEIYLKREGYNILKAYNGRAKAQKTKSKPKKPRKQGGKGRPFQAHTPTWTAAR